MDINKRTILWIVFAVSLVVLWNDWMVSNGKQSMFSMTPPPKVATVPAATATVTPVPGMATTVTDPSAPVALKSEIITVTTDVFKVDIDTAGGVVRHLELLKFKEPTHPGWLGGCFGLSKDCQTNRGTEKNEVLFDQGGGKTYLAQTGLIGAANLPNHQTIYAAKPGVRVLDNGNQVQLVMEAEQGGVKLTKTFTFKRGDYVIDVRHDVTNTGTVPVAPTLYLSLLHDGTKPATDSFFNSSYTGPTLYTSTDHYNKLKFDDIEKGKASHATQANDGWIAISQHFFVSAFIPADKVPRAIETRKEATNLYSISTKQPLGSIAPGATVSAESRLYSGPQDEKRLEAVAPGLDLVKDYIWLTIIAKPIFWVMTQLHNVLGNWGWTIVAFTILIKLLFFPLSAAGYRSMAKMKVVAPKMTAIREKYKSDPAKMNQATMELYKKEKINPLGGCLPILVQMPVFLALYWVLQSSVEFRGAPWILWIQDLSQHDPWCILPILYAISMFVQQKLNPAPADPMQAKMMLFMPLIFSVMFFFFPSGLVLYWVVNNLLSIAQQWVINKKLMPQPMK
ncbi:MAG: membrane protein insertase YidC [Pseudomonadota bacterium]|nr:membrane protein insertase YidC [Pseudomonadota bacterium]